jgi:2-aminoadipate transaminase
MCWKLSGSGEVKLEFHLPVTQVSVPPDFIDLGLGDPQLSMLPLEMIRQAAQDRLSQNDPAYLQYGANQGDGHFRQSLAKFLSNGYGFLVDPDNLFVIPGVSMGLHLISSFFTHTGDIVFVEEPTYLYALRIFADLGLQLIPIQTDENGILIESLEENLKLNSPKFLYTIPTFQNPSGCTLSPDRRQRLIELSQEHGFIIVADEVYHLLSYGETPPKPFASYTAIGNVISLGSFSKILAPGIRLGWIQANRAIIDRFISSGLLESGGGLNPFTSSIVRSILDTDGLNKNIAKLISVYRDRLSRLDAALHRELPDLPYQAPAGGYFIWARLPQGVLASDIQCRANELKVGYRPGYLFSSRGAMQEYFRLCFVFYEPEDLEQGVARLKQALHA